MPIAIDNRMHECQHEMHNAPSNLGVKPLSKALTSISLSVFGGSSIIKTLFY